MKAGILCEPAKSHKAGGGLKSIGQRVGAAAYFRLFLPHVWPPDERPDNWQTSAWMRRADPITALGADPRDEHFG